MTKEDFIEYVSGEYGVVPDCPFEKPYEDVKIFRHKDNKKWFVILIEVEKEKFGRKDKGKVWTIGVKCDPLLRNAFLQLKGVYVAYHMNKEHWLSVCLDEVEDNDLKTLVDISFDLTKKKYKQKRSA